MCLRVHHITDSHSLNAVKKEKAAGDSNTALAAVDRCVHCNLSHRIREMRHKHTDVENKLFNSQASSLSLLSRYDHDRTSVCGFHFVLTGVTLHVNKLIVWCKWHGNSYQRLTSSRQRHLQYGDSILEKKQNTDQYNSLCCFCSRHSLWHQCWWFQMEQAENKWD